MRQLRTYINQLATEIKAIEKAFGKTKNDSNIEAVCSTE